MKKIVCLLLILSAIALPASKGQDNASRDNPVPTIFAFGGDFNDVFLRYIISLTGKAEPKICFIPTAGADNPYVINYWYEKCLKFPVKPSVLRLFINSSSDQESFEESLLTVDAIIVGGGNTLDMMGIWKAQGIDTILIKAYKRGIVMAGGSAGSLCWFKCGISDSRPQKLTVVDCLGIIDASHCPHYNTEATRRPLYEDLILKGEIVPGYACDNDAGMLFRDGKLVRAVAARPDNFVYYISAKNGKLDKEKIETELIK